MIVANEEVEFIGGGPLDGVAQVMPPQDARIYYLVTRSAFVGREATVAESPYREQSTIPTLERHIYVRFGPRREGGAYYKYLGVER